MTATTGSIDVMNVLSISIPPKNICDQLCDSRMQEGAMISLPSTGHSLQSDSPSVAHHLAPEIAAEQRARYNKSSGVTRIDVPHFAGNPKANSAALALAHQFPSYQSHCTQSYLRTNYPVRRPLLSAGATVSAGQAGCLLSHLWEHPFKSSCPSYQTGRKKKQVDAQHNRHMYVVSIGNCAVIVTKNAP
jgi:hypothetical protein